MGLWPNLIRIFRVEESQDLPLPPSAPDANGGTTGKLPASYLQTTCKLPADYRQTLIMSLSTAAAVGRAPCSSTMAVIVPIVSV